MESERIFGPALVPTVTVARDEKLNTVVQVEIQTGDEAALQKLKEALEPLPQRYTVVARSRT
jgi:hypothetical protein